MLRAVPRSIFSWNFDVYLDRELIASIGMRWFGEGGSFEYAGGRFDLRKTGVFSGEFSLEENGRVIAEATKTAMVRMFEVRWAGESYTLRMRAFGKDLLPGVLCLCCYFYHLSRQVFCACG